MKILKKHLVTLWYENKQGERWVPRKKDLRYGLHPPKGFCYQVSRFPWDLTTNYCGPNGKVASGTRTWGDKLVLALVARGQYRLYDAITIAAISCERCMNALAHKMGLKWGYSVRSKWYRDNKTRCQFCETNDKNL